MVTVKSFLNMERGEGRLIESQNVFFSILLKKETLTLQIVLGFIIIFLSVFVSETKLSFLHKGEEK